MQTQKTLSYIYEHYPDAEIVVAMGPEFAKAFGNQYETVGGNKKNVKYIEDAIRESKVNNKIQEEIVK